MNNKEAILQTIDKIAHLAMQPENKWLLEELQRRWGKIEDNASLASSIDSVGKIEKYLAIDYNIDSIAVRIDYSFIQDEILRMKLEADWREMLRYRCGVRKHEPDFLEFCRYANLQAEGIVNYYCNCKYKTEKGIKRACGIAEDKNLTYYNKLYLLKENIPYSIRDLLYRRVYQARNIQSHRGNEIENLNERVQERIKNHGLPVYKVGELLLINREKCFFSEKMAYEGKYNEFMQELKDEDIDYGAYEVKVWALSAPYDDVEKALLFLVEKVKETV